MSKRTDLEARAAGVLFHQHDDIPTGGTPGNPESGTWNTNPTQLRDALEEIGAFFEETDDAHAALETKFNLEHNPDGSHDAPSEWAAEPNPPTFVAAGQFSLVGDRTPDYRVGDRLRLHQGVGGATLVVVAITAASYASGLNRTTLTVRTASNTGPVANSLVSIDRGLIRESAPRVGGFDLKDDGVDEARILKDGVVTLPKLAPGSVDRDKIVDGEVLTGKLANGAVTNPKLGAGAVQSANIGAQQVSGSHLAIGAVGPTRIATNAVQETHIADAQVRTRHIAPLNVTADHLAADAVRTYAIEDGAVLEGKIGAKAVTPAKRADERYQGPSGNSLAAAVEEQSGWSFFTVGSTQQRVVERAITFPVAFAELRSLRVDVVGVKIGSDPTHIGDSVATRHDLGTMTPSAVNENLVIANVKGGSVSLAGFTAIAGPNSTTATFVNGDRILFSWSARGRL